MLTSQSPSPICAREAAGAREARAQTPRKLAFAAAALPRASLPPLAAPPIYLRPRPRPDPARNSTPLLHPRLPPSPSPRGSGPAPSAAPPYRSVPSPASAPNSPPAPTPRPVRRGLVSPSRRAPPPNPRPTSPPNSARSGFGPRPGHRSLRFGPVCGHPPRPCLGAGLARCLRPRSRPRRAVRVWVPVPASVPAALPRLATRARSTQDPNPRGVGAAESKFLYLPSAPAAGPRHPPPPTAPPSPGQSPPAAVATLLFSTPPGKRAKREEEGGGGGCWDQAAGLREDTWGRRGRRRRKGGRACSSRGSPSQPRGSRNLSGQPQTPHWPRGKNGATFPGQPPAPGRGGASNAARGRRASVFARALCVTLYLCLVSEYGGAWGLACGGVPPPDAPPLPWPPTSLTRATSGQGSGAPAPRPPAGAAPAPAPKWDRCWGRENAGARCLFSRLPGGPPFVATFRAANSLGRPQRTAPGLGVEAPLGGGVTGARGLREEERE